jgi:hypothetical protein
LLRTVHQCENTACGWGICSSCTRQLSLRFSFFSYSPCMQEVLLLYLTVPNQKDERGENCPQKVMLAMQLTEQLSLEVQFSILLSRPGAPVSKLLLRLCLELVLPGQEKDSVLLYWRLSSGNEPYGSYIPVRLGRSFEVVGIEDCGAFVRDSSLLKEAAHILPQLPFSMQHM